MLERHVFIIGMPGSGKTSLGRRAARELGLSFTDTDARILSAMGCEDMQELYAKCGEAGYRRAEHNMLVQVTRETPGIISTGGGMIIDPVNRQIMRAWGLIILIERPLEDLLGDIKLERRPNLLEKGLSEVERLYAERMPVYHKTADIILRNDQGYHMGLYSLEKTIRDRFF